MLYRVLSRGGRLNHVFLSPANIKMELQIKINVEELVGKAEQLDLNKILKLWNKLKEGEEIILLNGMLKIKKL